MMTTLSTFHLGSEVVGTMRSVTLDTYGPMSLPRTVNSCEQGGHGHKHHTV